MTTIPIGSPFDRLIKLNGDAPPLFVVEERGEKTPFQVSASQFNNFEECQRKWYYEKIEKKRRPDTSSTMFGKTVHTLRESWLLSAQLPSGQSKEVLTALAGIQDLPRPGTVEVEKKIIVNLTDLERKAFILGYVDFFMLDQGVHNYRAPGLGLNFSVDGVSLVGDHKTTVNERYIKTSEILMGTGEYSSDPPDTQATIYAKAGLIEAAAKGLNTDFVDLFWHYLVKKSKPKAVPIHARMEAGRVNDNFHRLEGVAKRMLSIFDSQGITAADVEPNPRACNNYGGCPHRAYCPVTNQQKIGAIMSNLPTSPLAAVLAQKATAAGLDANAIANAPLPGAAAPAAAAQQAAAQQAAAPAQAAAPMASMAASFGAPAQAAAPAAAFGAPAQAAAPVAAPAAPFAGMAAAFGAPAQPAAAAPVAPPAAAPAAPAQAAPPTVDITQLFDQNQAAAAPAAPPVAAPVAAAVATTPTLAQTAAQMAPAGAQAPVTPPAEALVQPNPAQPVVPPDAAAPDLNATLPEKEAKKKRMSAKEKLLKQEMAATLAAGMLNPQNLSEQNLEAIFMLTDKIYDRYQ